jgi:hypothetical protein
MGLLMPLPEQLAAPEWIDSGAAIVGGLDLLGLRLPVQFIGGTLLDGVTTVTPSVRYLAFRAWLIDRYARTGRPDDWEEFTRFAARIESVLVLANLAQDRSIGGLIGADEAIRRLDSGTLELAISPLVLSPASTIYAGPSDQLHISSGRDDAVPALVVERGSPLASAVESQVSHNALIQRASSQGDGGSATLEELKELGTNLRIDRIPQIERDLLLNVIMPLKPLPSERARIGTYTSLLKLAKDLKARPSEREMLDRSCTMRQFAEPLLDATADGWTSYCVRDAIAVTHEAVLAAVMGELLAGPENGLAGVPHRAVVGALMERIEEHDAALRDLGLLGTNESVAKLSFREISDRVDAIVLPDSIIRNGLRRWPAGLTEPVLYRRALVAGAGALSLAPVAWLLAAVRVAGLVHEGGRNAGILSYQGWRRLGLSDVILPELERFRREDASFRDVAAELAYRTVRQHLQITWSRLQVDIRRDVALLTAEGDRWFSRRKDFRAGRTASRLVQAVGWLEQLRLVDGGGLTSDGEAALSRGLGILAESIAK